MENTNLGSIKNRAYLRGIKGKTFCFTPGKPYCDFTGSPATFEDGTPLPSKLRFEEGWSYNEASKTFKGTLILPKPHLTGCIK